MSFDWKVITLDEIVMHQKGFAFKSKDYIDSGIPVVRVSNFTMDSIDCSDLKYVNQSIAEKNASVQLVENDVVIATVGSWPTNPASVVGKTVCVPKNVSGSLLNQNAVRLRVKNNDDSDQSFLYYLLKNKDFSDYIVSTAQGSANQASITLKDIYGYEFAYPEQQHRQKIASYLTSIDRKISLNTQTNQTLEQMAQAIFKSWFVDFDPVKAKMNGEQPEGMDAATTSLFPEKLVESELGLIPEGWEVSTLSSLIQLTGGGTPKRSEETYWNGDIPWFSVRDVPSGSNVFVVDTDEKITELGLNKSSTKLLPKGTTIITARGTVGKLALVGTDMCMNQSCYGIRGKEVGDFYNYFNLNEAVSTLQRNTHGAVFDTITTKTFDTYSMAFSGIELANKFDALVAPLLQKIEANVRQNIELSTLRDTLLPKLLSGELIPSSMVEEV